MGPRRVGPKADPEQLLIYSEWTRDIYTLGRLAGGAHMVIMSLVEARTLAYSEATGARGRNLLRKSSLVSSRGQINSNQFL